MRWFDSNYDYVQELKEAWERGKKKIRNAYLILAAVLLAAGILLAVFPTGIFALIQYIAAIAVIMVGIYHFISYASMTYYFRDSMLLVSGILNVLLGVLLLFMPVELTAQVITFLLAFLLIFNGGEKLSLASRLRYYRIEGTGFLSFCGVLCITLAVVFLLLPFVSALALNYILAAYLIITAVVLFAEAIGMNRDRF
ncbi:MAG TPA: DUF308 domain-containing protein [Candidatus Merdiplasma excrementigallinarum]|uniref:DUF308 domain-containing protein n=1 Tax=Candidatus Merdiplasma excrementigallinarum TaxID=2840864 RepID=A0A9D1T7T7_9FIRM|nr:DUF308 domain-containing protein [Candidatus Merdiplasma excrementigallinarum]